MRHLRYTVRLTEWTLDETELTNESADCIDCSLYRSGAAQEEVADAEDARQLEPQKKATSHLKAELVKVQQELGQTANRATAESLKRKASRIGQFKEMTEDPESGSMTIVLEA